MRERFLAELWPLRSTPRWRPYAFVAAGPGWSYRRSADRAEVWVLPGRAPRREIVRRGYSFRGRVGVLLVPHETARAALIAAHRRSGVADAVPDSPGRLLSFWDDVAATSATGPWQHLWCGFERRKTVGAVTVLATAVLSVEGRSRALHLDVQLHAPGPKLLPSEAARWLAGLGDEWTTTLVRPDWCNLGRAPARGESLADGCRSLDAFLRGLRRA